MTARPAAARLSRTADACWSTSASRPGRASEATRPSTPSRAMSWSRYARALASVVSGAVAAESSFVVMPENVRDSGAVPGRRQPAGTRPRPGALLPSEQGHQAYHLRVVVAGLVGELGVEVDDVVVEPEQLRRPGQQDLVEYLGVALVVVAVALVLRQRSRQVGQ